jgi:hypothetical protein
MRKRHAWRAGLGLLACVSLFAGGIAAAAGAPASARAAHHGSASSAWQLAASGRLTSGTGRQRRVGLHVYLPRDCGIHKQDPSSGWPTVDLTVATLGRAADRTGEIERHDWSFTDTSCSSYSVGKRRITLHLPARDIRPFGALRLTARRDGPPSTCGHDITRHAALAGHLRFATHTRWGTFRGLGLSHATMTRYARGGPTCARRSYPPCGKGYEATYSPASGDLDVAVYDHRTRRPTASRVHELSRPDGALRIDTVALTSFTETVWHRPGHLGVSLHPSGDMVSGSARFTTMRKGRTGSLEDCQRHGRYEYDDVSEWEAGSFVNGHKPLRIRSELFPGFRFRTDRRDDTDTVRLDRFTNRYEGGH